MKVKWKRLFLWSSLGTVAVGATVAFARRSRKPGRPRITPYPIPAGRKLIVQTEVFQDAGSGVQDRYVFQPTAFKVWSVLELQSEPGRPNPEGNAIYHVTLLRGSPDPSVGVAEERVLERFYGTVRCVQPEEGRPHKNQIAVGAFLEIPRCYVGGASNGIESGEVHRSRAPVLNFTPGGEVAPSADERPF